MAQEHQACSMDKEKRRSKVVGTVVKQGGTSGQSIRSVQNLEDKPWKMRN